MEAKEGGIDPLNEDVIWARVLAEEEEERKQALMREKLQYRLSMSDVLAERNIVLLDEESFDRSHVLSEAERSRGDRCGSFWRVTSVDLLVLDGEINTWIAGFYAITGWWYVCYDGDGNNDDADCGETYTFHPGREDALITARERLSDWEQSRSE